MEDAAPLALETEDGATSQGVQGLLEAGISKETDSLLEPPKRKQA